MKEMSLEMRQKFAQWLLNGVHLQEQHFGEHSITLSPVTVGDIIRWAPAAGPATVAAGDMGMSAEGPTCFPASQAATATLAAYGGQSLGALLTLGSRDAQPLGLKTNNVEALHFQSGTVAAPGIAGFATTTPNTQSQIQVAGPGGGAGPAQTSVYTVGSGRAFLAPRYAADGAFTSVLDANDTGLVYYNTTTNRLRYWNGVAWTDVGTGVSSGGWLVGGNTGVVNPGVFGTVAGDNAGISVITDGNEILRLTSSGVAGTVGFVGYNNAAPTASVQITQQAATTGSPRALQVDGGAHTTLTNGSLTDVEFDLSATAQFTGGGAAIPVADAVFILGRNYTAAAAQTISRAATLDVGPAPTAGVNITITNRYALLVAAGGNGLAAFGDNIISIIDNTSAVGTNSQRWLSVNTGPTGFEVWNGAGDANPAALLFSNGGNGELLLGPGAAVSGDVRLLRAASFAAAGVVGPVPVPAATYHQLVIDSPAGGPGDVVAVVPSSAATPAAGFGSIGSDPAVLGVGAPLIKWTLGRFFAVITGDLVMLDSEGKAHWTFKEDAGRILVNDNITNKTYKLLMEEVKAPKGMTFVRGTHK
jgi:hypothetical protein